MDGGSRVRIGARHVVVAGVGVTASTLASRAAFDGAERGGWREFAAAAASLPAGGAVAGAVVGSAMLIAPPLRAAGRDTARLAAGGLAGLAGGLVAAEVLDLGTRPASVADAELPPADPGRVQSIVDETWRGIDTSQQDIVLWAPGTLRSAIPGEFVHGVEQAFGPSVSVSKLPTRMDYQIMQGVADTAAALREIVARLHDQRRPGQRILLAGESQGSWAIGAALTDPQTRGAVDRTVLWGNPGISPHQFESGADPRVVELTDEYDVVAQPLRGDGPMVLEGLSDTFDGEWWNAWRLPAALLANPYPASLLARSGVRQLTPDGYGRDPHNYREHMSVAARLLADAPRPEDASRGESPRRGLT